MRSAEAIKATINAVEGIFDADVANAIISDTEPFERAARMLGNRFGDASDIDDSVSDIYGDTEQHTLDWLIHDADSPGAWFCSKVRDYI